MIYLIKALITSELTDDTFVALVDSFNQVFKKQFSTQHFSRKYKNSSLGFSFHGLLYCNENVVGCFTVIPRTYQVNNAEYRFGLACDAFILEEHRKDELFLKRMHQAVVERLNDFNVSFVFSIPNDIAYPYWKYLVKYKDIGELNYYVYPVRVGALVSAFKLFDRVSKLFAGVWPYMLSITKNDKPLYKEESNISLLINEEYLAQRFDSSYVATRLSSNSYFIYKIIEEDNVRVAYLFLIVPATTKALNNAVSFFLKKKNEFDVIMFIGNWQKNIKSLIKVPASKAPRKQRFIGTIINKNLCPDGILDINNWRLSLADFDNR
jgi:hypothetical protein